MLKTLHEEQVEQIEHGYARKYFREYYNKSNCVLLWFFLMMYQKNERMLMTPKVNALLRTEKEKEKLRVISS